MIILHDDIVQGSQQWHDLRIGKFTGSNAYKLLSSFGAHEYAKAIEGSFKGNFSTHRGHLLEDEAIDLYQQITKQPVVKTGFVSNDDFPTCLYSPDGLAADMVIEVKCFGEKPHMAIYNGEIPLKILAQIHFGMMICEKRAARLVIYHPKLEPKKAFKYIDIPYDRKIQNNFRRIIQGVDYAVA